MNRKFAHAYIKSSVTCFLVIGCLLYQTLASTPVQASQLHGKNNNPALAPLGGCSIFPANNIWNTRVDNLPVHARSNQWVNSIGRYTGFHMDFGSGTWDGGPIGIPYNIVGAGVTKIPVSFYYDDES